MKIFNYLTDEDWQSDIAKNLVLAVLAAFAFAFAFAFALAALTALAALAALAALTALTVLAALAFADHKIMLFIGAYLHYRKRIRKELKKEQPE